MHVLITDSGVGGLSVCAYAEQYLRSNGFDESRIVTRYRIPETALETIAFFLDDVSPKTVRAFTNYTFAPGLF